MRASAGTGFAPPTATTEETEAIGLRSIRPGAELRRERSFGSMLDVNGELAGTELLVTAYASVIGDAIQLADAGDGSGEGILKNASSSTRIGGVEGAAVWRFDADVVPGQTVYQEGSLRKNGKEWGRSNFHNPRFANRK